MLHGGRCHNGLMGGNLDTNYFLPKNTCSFCISLLTTLTLYGSWGLYLNENRGRDGVAEQADTTSNKCQEFQN